MLLDNEQNKKDHKVYEWIIDNTESGTFDMVTGYFTIGALAYLSKQINQKISQFRMVLGDITNVDNENFRPIDLLNENITVEAALKLSQLAKETVNFLKQDKVEAKTLEPNFCHAKIYLYKNEHSDNKKNYYITGSSNLTEAGIGLKATSNVELNILGTGIDPQYKELAEWFNNLWDKPQAHAEKTIVDVDGKTKKIPFKEYLISEIEKIFKEYTPKELYYKVLFELFGSQLKTADPDYNQQIGALENTVIYNTLYDFQKKGALSLIRMLQNYNGAILADAVGLGKTWTALAVMRYFQSKGYRVILFCPKKLRNNWVQYQFGNGSRFEKDEIEYFVRHHTDLQDERLDNTDFSLARIQRSQKLLIVIDESHNLRNDKSSRYKFLVEKILQSDKKNRDVKVLQLSATPINNKLLDIRNQFKLIIKGEDNGFEDGKLQISSLENIFRTAQKDYAEWCKKPERKILGLITKLPDNFFKLTDSLIVARTRKMIEGEFGEIKFPQKEIPDNEYIALENIGNLKSFADILDSIKIKMTAYKPSNYIEERRHAENVLQDDVAREKFLVKMMYILLIKRLESSWYAFTLTVGNILDHHENALDKVNQFIEGKKEIILEGMISEEDIEEIEDTAAEISAVVSEKEEATPITLGKKNPVELSQISDIKIFKSDLEQDVKKLQELMQNLIDFENQFKKNISKDPKLERLLEIIREKQEKENKKVLIFTAFKDTAKFLYSELKKRSIGRVAYVSGTQIETFDGYDKKNIFENTLERFAPIAKLFNEKDWNEKQDSEFMQTDKFKGLSKEKQYAEWREWILKTDKKTADKLNNPIDILIATDCLSEGQNLQDCDLVINYDIHWNPVRLIQRMGRIDRLASPNKTIRGINFWPAKNYEDYLNLKSRVENRLAAMTLVGTEIDDTLTQELQDMIKENPLLSEQTQRMLKQLQLTWDDVEGGEETLGLNNLSLEHFRQELFDFFKQNEEFFRKIPNGVFTGFKFYPKSKWEQIPDSIVAVLGYPQNKNKKKDYVYQEIYLLHQNYREETHNMILLQNRQEILSFLRSYKDEKRYVPKEIDDGDADVIDKLAKAIEIWLTAQANPEAKNQIQSLFSGDLDPKVVSSNQPKVEEKFRGKNFDLINWFVISK